jgi:hypothetical protein
MRIFPALLLSSLALLGACASQPEAPIFTANTGATCELATVPPGAVLGVRDGMNIATYPPQVTRGMTGCQRVWFGEPARRDSMQVLATYYFQQGEVRRLGAPAGGPGAGRRDLRLPLPRRFARHVQFAERRAVPEDV